ncbi:MAG: hypothetical protein GY874_19810 [Desulfobacteraceae bacterium]|nr:hypothetical protein [Desulfobacteraceae bacterium]
MLSLMRKHAHSWIIKVVLFAIVVVFCFLGINTYRSREDTLVASVNGEKITMQKFEKSYRNIVNTYRRMYGDNLSEDMLKMLNPRKTALDQLIQRMLMMQEARRLKIEVTDKELDDAIQRYPAFQVDGVFSQKRAVELLSASQYTISDFRSFYRDDLVIEKMRALVLEGVAVSDEEVRQWFGWQNSEVNLTYFLFSPNNYKDITPSDEDVKAHFEANTQKYKTDPQVKTHYMFFDPKKYLDQISISDEAVKLYYDRNPDEFQTEKTVEARHILLKLDEDADEKAVAAQKEKADKIYAMATKGDDFAKLAKTHSEGPTKDKGGNLGAFKRDSMVKPFSDKAFSMKAGEISEPVLTKFGWHIIKVEKVNEAARSLFESVADTIRTKLLNEKSRDKAFEEAENVYQNLLDGDDLIAAGKTYEVPVDTTELFSQKNPPKQKGIQNPGKFAQISFQLEKMAISEIQDFGNGYYLLQVVDRVEPAVPEFDTVKDKVVTETKKAKQQERAQSDAKAFLKAIAGKDPLPGLLEKYKVKEMDTGFFKRSASIPKIGYERQIIDVAFKLTKENPLGKEPVQGRQGWYVLRLKERKPASEDLYEKEKQSIISRLTNQKKQAAMKQWIDDLKSHGKIDINEELVQ